MANKNQSDINLMYYEHLRSVPQEAKKSFSNGRFSGTDINPMWRIKKLTEVFGMAGIGWYTEVVKREMITSTDDKTQCAFIGINLYVKVDGEWSKPIYGEGGNTMTAQTKNGLFVTDEAYKMAYTDALSNASKSLGLGADVWFENDKSHSTKYDLQGEREKDGTPAKEIDPIDDLITKCINVCTTTDQVMEIWNGNKELQSNAKFKAAISAKGKQLKENAA